MTINNPEAQTALQGPENPSNAQEVNDTVTGPEELVQAASDPVESMRAELAHEYAVKLAQAELRVKAAEAGVSLPDALMNALNLEKLVGEDGRPSPQAISHILEPFTRTPTPAYRQDIGLGRQGNPYRYARHTSLDARKR